MAAWSKITVYACREVYEVLYALWYNNCLQKLTTDQIRSIGSLVYKDDTFWAKLPNIVGNTDKRSLQYTLGLALKANSWKEVNNVLNALWGAGAFRSLSSTQLFTVGEQVCTVDRFWQSLPRRIGKSNKDQLRERLGQNLDESQ